ncbi:DNA polymerase III subunit delta [Riemerella columbipharyngis]|uniref:DNA polymerase III, delta subunit n=1 Tax=Riemerella columbipharyngis TaxID=1071918 RepID=A0A1G6YM25_9FLAO|nr:DNA polymerase III subunit delta [Riemerella columbipharyngis]SDD90596.1 DNA polymerase III, delta subunit [Riemerella columbipharyngis]
MKELKSILKSIKNKEFQPIYFFYGNEPYFIDLAVKHFETDALDETEKAFDQKVFYGKDISLEEVIAVARQYPMIAQKQLVIYKEAQMSTLKPSDKKAVEAYVNNPSDTTILVIAYKDESDGGRKKEGGKTLSKLFGKHKMLYESSKVKEWQLAAHIQGEIAQMNLESDPDIPQLLADYMGDNLSRIANELEKLRLVMKPGDKITKDIVEKHIGISKLYNHFELQRAIAARNYEKAMRIAFYMAKDPKSNFSLTIGTLYSFFSKLTICCSMKGSSDSEIMSAIKMSPNQSYFYKEYKEAATKYSLKDCTRIISILREMDMKNKGMGGTLNEEDIYKELTYKILNIDKIKVKVL